MGKPKIHRTKHSLDAPAKNPCYVEMMCGKKHAGQKGMLYTDVWVEVTCRDCLKHFKITGVGLVKTGTGSGHIHTKGNGDGEPRKPRIDTLLRLLMGLRRTYRRPNRDQRGVMKALRQSIEYFEWLKKKGGKG